MFGFFKNIIIELAYWTYKLIVQGELFQNITMLKIVGTDAHYSFLRT